MASTITVHDCLGREFSPDLISEIRVGALHGFVVPVAELKKLAATTIE
jgi:hypothetical protein